ncbi:NEL-type E3 ubiquitin ligase domain-containing protein [Pseudomonas thivervalensis]|uniref:NEL-type E3 ubiquitin ligase domain-containing protein n=1 Tax=Pseudomonas thivervalensis TaxID=86265 RepID=UPI00087CD8EC|nr:NEL-type E3 ubiquitin ligase domain-containing protein [Pseudomonas thivervalensis]SDG51877.1 C-terminal novel E3 ligase, LRR-interacting [Pseudomonas thivervalensis]
MPTLEPSVATAPNPDLLPNSHERIAHAVPRWLVGLGSQQRAALLQAAGPIPTGSAQASAADRDHLKSAVQASWQSHGKLEQLLARLQPIETFAEPLLAAALKKRFNLTLDVRQTCLRLYIPEGVSVAYRTRTLSLLDAALQNFEAKEARPGFFDEASCFITRPSASGQFDILAVGNTLTLPAFVALCRELDIGGRYQTYLKNNLLEEPVAGAVVQECFHNDDKDAFRAAAALGRIKGDLGPQARQALQAFIAGKPCMDYRGRPYYCHALVLFDVSLTDILMIAPALEQSRQNSPVLVYIPHDPEHPFKQYSSTAAFAAALAARLRSDRFQQFFSRFVPVADRGRFSAALNEQLSKARRDLVQTPRLRMSSERVRGDIWDWSYEQRLNRIIRDARAVAVPTGDEDFKSRWARWDSFMGVATTVLEMAAFAAASFVPVLGEALLAYTVYQLLDETFEGIVDWSHGQRAEAAAHLLGVAENIALMGLFVAGGKVVGAVRSTRPSPFVEQMKVVRSRDGNSRLWHPDLTPYQQPLVLDEGARPQANGLFLHQGQEVLLLDGQPFVVEQAANSGPYRIQHPTRPDAYAPRLAHNEVGAWVHEAERPLSWQGAKLMRRLGHSVEAFSDETLEQIRIVSGVEESSLRQLYVEHARPPVLLAETIKRFRAEQGSPVAIEPVVGEAGGAGAQVLHGEFPQMPRAVVDELLIDVTEVERRQMSERGYLPLRLRQSARRAMDEWRIVQAYEALYLPTKGNPDTWRLALHSLEQLPGWPTDVRIEIRDGALEGPLLDSVGPSSSSVRKVLVPVEEATPRLFGEQANSVDSADDFYTDVLHALTEAELRMLGYNLGDGPLLRRAVQRAPLDRATFRKILLGATRAVEDPPIVERLLGEQPGYGRIDERLLGAGDGLNLEGRFQVLYPDASEQAFSKFVGSFPSEAMALENLRTREIEFEGLSRALEDWVAIERGDTLPINQRYHKRKLASTLKQCWRAGLDPSPEGYALDLDHHWSHDFLDYFPTLEVSFAHVSSLQWRQGALRVDMGPFLDYFPDLKALDLSHNNLVTAPRLNYADLQRLDLADNRLNLTAENVAEIAGLGRLEVLRLSNNPTLTLPPDISLMPELSVLDLQNTGIADWPPGLFSTARPPAFELNLMDNPISRIPQVTPGSEQARLIARTRLSRDQLPDDCLRQFQDYMRSVGYDPARSYPPKGELTSQHWLEDVDAEQRVARQRTWDELEREAGAQGFFEVLEQLTEAADYVEATYRPQLVERVWRMLDAMSEDATLREELFRMAINPDSCADAGAQLFNEMGVKVLVHEAYREGDAGKVEAKLLALAKGKSRLDQVNEIARATIQSRLQAGETFIALDEDGELTGTIDEVEVYLAFQTGLAERLELPWQSKGMLFQALADVDEAALSQAYQSVLALETGDGLVNQMIGQRFWRRYLKKRYPQAFLQNSIKYAEQAEALLDAQLTGAISKEQYEQGMIELGYGRTELLRRLSRQLLEIPGR